VWGTGATNAFAVGGEGVVLRFDGSSWNQSADLDANALLDVWGTSDANIYAVGEKTGENAEGNAFRFNGSTWAGINVGTSQRLTSVWGSASNNVFVTSVGRIRRWNGEVWLNQDTNAPFTRFQAIWGPAGSPVYAVGDSPVAWRGRPE
jgi:hypothetical protein